MMRQKGMEENTTMNRTRNKLFELKQKLLQGNSTRKSTNKFSSRDDELDYNNANDDNTMVPETKALQDQIFNAYMNNINQVRENFIKNEKKDDKKKKK